MTTENESAPQRRPNSRPRFYSRSKVCQPCVDKKELDYIDEDNLKKFLSDRYMIEARRKSGMCAKCQRSLAKAVKKARHLALLPFSPAQRGALPVHYRPRSS